MEREININYVVIVGAVIIMVGIGILPIILSPPSLTVAYENEDKEAKIIIDADCKQLLDIYLNEEDEYIRSSEKMAKKYFDVKCNAYSPSEIDE